MDGGKAIEAGSAGLGFSPANSQTNKVAEAAVFNIEYRIAMNGRDLLLAFWDLDGVLFFSFLSVHDLICCIFFFS